jgi:hypothetical protein
MPGISVIHFPSAQKILLTAAQCNCESSPRRKVLSRARRDRECPCALAACGLLFPWRAGSSVSGTVRCFSGGYPAPRDDGGWPRLPRFGVCVFPRLARSQTQRLKASSAPPAKRPSPSHPSPFPLSPRRGEKGAVKKQGSANLFVRSAVFSVGGEPQTSKTGLCYHRPITVHHPESS